MHLRPTAIYTYINYETTQESRSLPINSLSKYSKQATASLSWGLPVGLGEKYSKRFPLAQWWPRLFVVFEFMYLDCRRSQVHGLYPHSPGWGYVFFFRCWGVSSRLFTWKFVKNGSWQECFNFQPPSRRWATSYIDCAYKKEHIPFIHAWSINYCCRLHLLVFRVLSSSRAA